MKVYLCWLILIATTFTLSAQTINYKLHPRSEQKEVASLPEFHLSLASGKVVLIRGVVLVDIFKQNEYPYTLILLDRDGHELVRRKTTGWVIFDVLEMNGQPQLFFADATGMLQVVALDESTLEDRGAARPVLQLASAKKNPSTINHYNFPTLAWSPDRTAFAVVRSEVVDRKFRYTVSVFDTALQERYAQPVPMNHNSSYFLRLQNV